MTPYDRLDTQINIEIEHPCLLYEDENEDEISSETDILASCRTLFNEIAREVDF